MRSAVRVAQSDATVLIEGETGTGKEGMARFVHVSSNRADKDFLAVNCAALPETMMEAMLFGHRKGAFTGAAASSHGLFHAANGGTLFLDDIAALPLSLLATLQVGGAHVQTTANNAHPVGRLPLEIKTQISNY